MNYIPEDNDNRFLTGNVFQKSGLYLPAGYTRVTASLDCCRYTSLFDFDLISADRKTSQPWYNVPSEGSHVSLLLFH